MCARGWFIEGKFYLNRWWTTRVTWDWVLYWRRCRFSLYFDRALELEQLLSDSLQQCLFNWSLWKSLKCKCLTSFGNKLSEIWGWWNLCLENVGPSNSTPKYLIFIDIYDVLTQESQFLKFFSVFRYPLYTETVELIFVISLGLGKINLWGEG